MKAIEEAIVARRKIEEELRQRLVRFSEETGLQVTSVDVSAMETTRMESRYPEFADYRVQVEVTLRR